MDLPEVLPADGVLPGPQREQRGAGELAVRRAHHRPRDTQQGPWDALLWLSRALERWKRFSDRPRHRSFPRGVCIQLHCSTMVYEGLPCIKQLQGCK